MKGTVIPILAAFALVAVLLGGTLATASAAPVQERANADPNPTKERLAHELGVKDIKTGIHQSPAVRILTQEIPEDLVEQVPETLREAQSLIGEEAQQVVIFDSSGHYYAVITYDNGFFTAEVHDTVETDQSHEGDQFWGAYQNGKYAGLYDDGSLTSIEGTYQKWPHKKSPTYLWTMNFDGIRAHVWGLGTGLST